MIIVLSGRSGIGKTTVINYLTRNNSFRTFASCTTRPKRTGELENIDYCFVDDKTFLKYRSNGNLLDCINISGYFYGFPLRNIKIALENHENCIVNLIAESGLLLKKIIPNTLLIYLTFPTEQSQIERLRGRGMSEYEIGIRLRDDPNSKEKPPYYDMEIVNFESKKTAKIIENIKNKKEVLK